MFHGGGDVHFHLSVPVGIDEQDGEFGMFRQQGQRPFQSQCHVHRRHRVGERAALRHDGGRKQVAFGISSRRRVDDVRVFPSVGPRVEIAVIAGGGDTRLRYIDDGARAGAGKVISLIGGVDGDVPAFAGGIDAAAENLAAPH